MNRPTKNISSGGAILFDGLEAVCWLISMSSDIRAARVINMSPGQLYTFVFTQNATGGHVMNWPPNCMNANPIDRTANSITVQNFIGTTGGILQANISSSWSKP